MYYSSDTIQFLRLAEEDGFVERITDERPKSFIIAEVDNMSKIYQIIKSFTITFKFSYYGYSKEKSCFIN